MIREKPITGPLLWVYAGPTDDPLAPFLLTVALDYDADCVPWLRGMQGSGFNRQVMRELVDYFHVRAVVIVCARRAPGHVLPGARRVGSHWEWDIPTLHCRFNERKKTS